MHDFRSMLTCLEDQGDLVRITREVDPKFEVAALMIQLEAQGKSFIFENVKGAQVPLVGGVMSDISRFAMAHKLPANQPFTRQDHAKLIEKAIADPVPAAHVNGGPVKEVIKKGEDANLSDLPVPTFFEDDSGPFITAAVGISRHPETGELNVGFYRALILSDGSLTINASSMSDLRAIYQINREAGTQMPIALAIGVPPSLLAAAASKPPSTTSEFDVAGALQGKPLDLVKCENSDLLVPAEAEIVIEGVVDFSEEVTQTLGEFAGQYGPETNAITKVTAITHRDDAMFHSVTAGANPEHNTLGTVAIYGIERMIREDLKKQFPAIKELNVLIDAPVTGPMLQLAIVIDKKNDEEPKELIKAAFQTTAGFMPVGKIFRRIVVVDDDIDIRNYGDVEWAVWSRATDPAQFMVLPGFASWELDRGTPDDETSVRLGVDATMRLDNTDRLKRPVVPDAQKYRLEEYL